MDKFIKIAENYNTARLRVGKVDLLEPGLLASEQPTNLASYLSSMFTLIIALVALASVVMITVAGLQYALSAVPGAKNSAKARIRDAVGGLVLALGAYLILRTINPNLVSLQIFGGS